VTVQVASAPRRATSSVGAADPSEFYDAYTFDVEVRSTWQRARRRFLRHHLATGSLGVLVILFGAGLLASDLAPYGYLEVDLSSLSHAPSWAHPFAGYFGGVIGELLMRLTDLFLIFPPLIVVLVAAAYLHVTTAFSVSLLLSSLLWMPLARIVRGAALELREKEYVAAARAVGASDLRIIVRHVLPNAVGSIAVAATVMTAGAIVLETTLSFLGLFERQSFPSLGAVLAGANFEGLVNWWGLFFPGLVLVLILVSIYFVGDGLRDALDPSGGRTATHSRRRRVTQDLSDQQGHASPSR